MDPATLTNAAVQLTADQIQGMIQERIIGLIISMFLIVVGGICGSKIRNEVGKTIGIILAIIGGIGTITFTIQLINLSTQVV